MTDTQHRPLLPLLPSGPHGSRSHLTCRYRCGNACDQPVPNPTEHPEFRDVAARALARRSVLQAGAAIGAVALATTAAPPAARSRPSPLPQARDARAGVWAPTGGHPCRPTSATR